jgi:hypothetical protein
MEDLADIDFEGMRVKVLVLAGKIEFIRLDIDARQKNRIAGKKGEACCTTGTK